jgi:flagellin
MGGFSINTNIDALSAYNALAQINTNTEKAQLRLATGKRINSVADDTSGYNVGKSLDQKVQLMQAAQSNVGSAQDMLSTAESALSNVKDLITQIKAKVATATNPATDNTSTSNDIKALANEIANIFATTKYNNTTLLSSVANSGSFSFQTGADYTDKLSIDYASAGSLTGTAGVTLSGVTLSNVGDPVADSLQTLNAVGTTAAAIGSIVDTLNTFEAAVTTALGSIGNFDQRLSVKSDFLTSAISNSQASVSRLFDANIAQEQLNATKGQIQQQVATSMLSQLNSAPQNLLRLFQ